MNRLRCYTNASVFGLCFILSTTATRAAITQVGNVVPDVFVGRTSPGSLTVDGGSVLASFDGYLGFNAGVTGTATITDPGSRWNINTGLRVGHNGTGILNIERGGQVTASITNTDYIGRNPGSVGTATVTGANSKLIGGYMRVAQEGTGTLNVTSGGIVTSTSAMIGEADTANGTVVVSGAGSQWNVEGGMRVGWDGNGSLRIESGGAVNSGNNFNSWLAYQPESTGAVTVTGAGSQWTSGFQLYVGHRGQATVDVTDGGVISTLATKLGFDPGASGTVSVMGVGSKWNNSTQFEVGTSGTGKLTVADGGELTTGTLYASLADLFGNGTISATQGAVVDATLNFDAAHGTQALSTFGSGGTLKVKASGGDLGVGYKGTGTMTVTDGVQVTSDFGYLAYNPGSMGTATVSGAGSKWTTGNNLNIGHRGTGLLTVEASAKVMSELISVGNFGNGTLNVLTGGQVTSAAGKVGAFSTSTGLAIIAGAGSQWKVSGDLLVGDQGTGTLNVSAGGQVTSANGFVRGWSEGRTGNVNITGADSQWNVGERLTIGSRGTLSIAEGGNVAAETLYASLDSLQGNGTIVATSGARLDADFVFDAATPNTQTFTFGSGGTLTVGTGGELGIGYRTKGTLQILDGVTINSTEGYIHGTLDAASVGTVSGAGSQWLVSGGLRIGGHLTVENGGKVASFTGVVENIADLYDNPPAIVTIAGAGSEWNNSSELTVGYNGTGTLIVKDGGVVRNTDGYLGRDQYEGGVGRATVTGAGSQWINSGFLSIGILGYGELTITDGGLVTSNDAYLRPFYGDLVWGVSRVKISGAGSKWTVAEVLDIYGETPSGVRISIADGGEMTNGEANIFGDAIITVTGQGSQWTNSKSLSLGSDSVVHIRDGGRLVTRHLDVFDTRLTIDVGSGSLLSVGDGTGQTPIYGDATIQIIAGPAALPGSQHSPIAAGGWEGTATFEAIGGTWNDTTHVFTVSDAVPGESDIPMTLDLALHQRAMLYDATRGRHLGVSLLSQSGLATLTGTVLDGAILDALVEPGQHLLSAWDLNLTGAALGDPLYLSFAIPSVVNGSTVSVWTRDGNRWREVNAPDLTVAGGYASFTATNGGAFALTVMVPEPATQLLGIVVAGVSMLPRRRRSLPRP